MVSPQGARERAQQPPNNLSLPPTAPLPHTGPATLSLSSVNPALWTSLFSH